MASRRCITAVVVGAPVDHFEANSVAVDAAMDEAKVASGVMVGAADVVEVTSVAVVVRKAASKTRAFGSSDSPTIRQSSTPSGSALALASAR